MASKRLSKDETEQLIELVRQKPYLYDVTDPDHADATKVANAWQAITEKMGLQDKGYSLKEKWKNLRDYYIRKRREQKGKSGDGAKQKVKWPFFELMQFLNDYAVENSQTDSNVDEVPITKEDEQDLSTYDADTQSTIESQEASDDDRSTNQLSQTSRQNERASMPAVKNLPRQERKVKRRSNTDDPLDEEIKQLIRERKQDRKELIGMSNMGANELFFQSCAIRTNKLPPTMQAFVQMQVSQLLFQAEMSPSPPVRPMASVVLPPCSQPTPSTGATISGFPTPSDRQFATAAARAPTITEDSMIAGEHSRYSSATSLSQSADIMTCAANCVLDG